MSLTFTLRLPAGSQTPFLTLSRRVFLVKVDLSPSNNLTTTPPASPVVWQIELHNGADNRLVKALINDALKPALQFVEREWRKERAEGKSKNDKNAGAAALVIVGRLDQEKFFSNGAPIFPDATRDIQALFG